MSKKDTVKRIKEIMRKHNIHITDLLDIKYQKPKQLVKMKCGNNRLEHEYRSMGNGDFACKWCGKYSNEPEPGQEYWKDFANR